MNERRLKTRTSINHPVIYVIGNSKGQVETQGVGLALDISEDGMMLESDSPIEATTLTIRASCENSETFGVEAVLVYSMPHFDGKYRSGIRFVGRPDDISQFVGMLKRSLCRGENGR